MIFEMLRWWYGPGWTGALKRVASWTRGVENAFSVSLLVQTLFSPWRRIVSVAQRGLDAKMHAAMDNLVSRAVGFFIRLFVLLAAGVAMLGALVAGVVMAVAWPFLPLLVVALTVKGVVG